MNLFKILGQKALRHTLHRIVSKNLRDDERLTDSQREVILELLELLSLGASLNVKEISKKLNIGIITLSKAIEYLEESGFIKVKGPIMSEIKNKIEPRYILLWHKIYGKILNMEKMIKGFQKKVIGNES